VAIEALACARKFSLRLYVMHFSAILINYVQRTSVPWFIPTTAFVVFFSSLRPPIVMGRPLYFCPVVSFIFFFFYLFPRLISAVAVWMSAIRDSWICRTRNCRTGKWWTKSQGWKMMDWKMD